MKKFLFFLTMSIGLIQWTNAQVIELIGEGVMGQTNPVLVIPNPGTVDHVVVEAAGVFRMFPDYNDPEPADVYFSDSDENTALTTPSSFIEASPQKTIDLSAYPQKWGYYTATFNTVDAGGITLNNTGQENYIVSFTAYVYRNGSSGIYSEAKGEHAFLFRNGSLDPMVYNFTIPFSLVSRDVVVSIPFSDVNADGRYSMIDVTPDGLSTTHVEFDDNNMGERLHIETVTIPDVPGDITNVTVSIYSPTPFNGIDTKNGDSFITSAMVLTTTYDQGCTLTWGYWKTHSEEYGPAAHPDPTWDEVGGPDAPFFISEQTYMEVLNTSVKGNAYYILAHQYIAAQLNMYGADISAVLDEFNEATTLLNTYTPAEIKAMKGNDPIRKMFTDLGETLDDFNMGLIGPEHCDDMEDLKSAEIARDKNVDFTVYPNPVRGNATLSFSPVYDGNAIVDIYSSTGQKSSTLFNQKVRKDVPVRFEFDGNRFNEGLYIIRFQNGSSSVTRKIQISR